MSTNRRGSGARSRSKSASSKSPPWREFEKAVASFVASTDPRAKVTHNAFTPDGQTQRPRQRDVWVEGTIGSFPLKILVSCKRYKRRLDEDHIDAFSGVVRNSGAHLGVLYSYSGFTEPAVEKAKKLQPAIECCRLFTYQPAELPEVLRFKGYYCDPALGLFVRPGQDTTRWEGVSWRVALETINSRPPVQKGLRWSAAFDVGQPALGRSVLDDFAPWFAAAEQKASDAFHKNTIPASSEFEFTVPAASERPRLRCTAWLNWHLLRIRVEAPLLNGSYSFTRDKFDGEVRPQPFHWPPKSEGAEWEEADTFPSIGSWIAFIPNGNDVRVFLLERFGSQLVLEPKCCRPPSWNDSGGTLPEPPSFNEANLDQNHPQRPSVEDDPPQSAAVYSEIGVQFKWPPYFISPSPVPTDLRERCRSLGRVTTGWKADPSSRTKSVAIFTTRTLAELVITRMKDSGVIVPHPPKDFTELIATLETMKEFGETTILVDGVVPGSPGTSLDHFIQVVRIAQAANKRAP